MLTLTNTSQLGRVLTPLEAAISAFVYGAYGLGGPAVIKMIRDRRSPGRHPSIPSVLANDHFVNFIERVAGRR